MSNEFFDKLSRSSQYSFFKEFKVSEDIPLREDDYEKLLITIETILDDKEFAFIGGSSIFTSDGTQILIVARNERIADDLHKTAEIIRDMDEVKLFFENLPTGIEKDGLGHLEFEYFEMFFGNVLSGDFAIAFQVIDNKKEKIPLMNFHLEEVKNIFDEIDFSSNKGVVSKKGSSGKGERKKSTSGTPTPSFSSTPTPSMSSTPKPTMEADIQKEEEDEKEKKEREKRSAPSNVDPVTGKPKKLMTREDYKISLATRLKELED